MRMLYRWIFCCVSIAVWVATPAQAVRRELPEIWFAPLQPTFRTDGAQAGALDYFSLFSKDAPWSYSASKISAFKIYPELLRDGTDAQIGLLISGLADRKIALALESPVLVDSSRCDAPSDGISWIVGLVARLKRLGGNLQAFSMVGPLVDGHATTKSHGCRKDLADVAAEAARTVAALRQLYPNLVVGEIEPIGHGPSFPNWQELPAWFDAWSKATGTPLAYLHLDTTWGGDWHDDMLFAARQTRKAGVRFGVIYKGDPSDLSDSAFTSNAIAHAREVEAVLSGAPDDVILQSWEDYPRHALPDMDLSTMTGLVRAYLRENVHIVLERGNKGRLLKDDGTAVEHGVLSLEIHDPLSNQTLVPTSISGTSPHSATSAIFALRVHTECGCRAREANLLVSGFDFRQQDSGKVLHGDLGSWAAIATSQKSGSAVRKEPVLQFRVDPDRQILLNGTSFSVLADKAFELTFSLNVEPESDGTGFFALIFLGRDGKEIRRVPQFVHATWRHLQTLSTGSDASFEIPSIAIPPGALMRLQFAGDLALQPTELTLP